MVRPGRKSWQAGWLCACLMSVSCAQSGAVPGLVRKAEAVSKPILSAKRLAGVTSSEVVVASTGATVPQVADGQRLDSFEFSGTQYHLFRLKQASDWSRVASSVRRQADVVACETNLPVTALNDETWPDDEFFPLQWSLQAKRIPQVWLRGKGSIDVTVAVIDTGVDASHPDLLNRVVTGPDFAHKPKNLLDRRDKNGAMDEGGHGTHCAGIIAANANNIVGIAGIAPQVRIMPVRVLDEKGLGHQFNVMKGIAYAINQGARIINLSLGGNRTSSVERRFYEAAVQSKTLIIAAAGNGGESLDFPAAYPGVLSVGATNERGELAYFSNRGTALSLTAPGVGILSTYPNQAYAKTSGTSAAAPFVAGVAALVWSQHPDWSPQQVRDHLERTADDRGAPGIDPLYGRGEINPVAAVNN